MDLKEYKRSPDWFNRVSNNNLSASIVIPAYNVAHNLKNTLLSLNQQTYSCDLFEVIIIDDGSDDGTDTVVKQIQWNYDIKYYYKKRTGRAVAQNRNIGISNASAELVIFLDADSYCSSNLIERHIKTHQERDNVYVIGEIRMLDQDGYLDDVIKIDLQHLAQKKLPTQPSLKGRCYCWTYNWIQRLLVANNDKLTFWLTGAHSSVKKKDLIMVGGFDEQFDQHWGDEDAELGYRLEKIGLKVKVIYDAMIFHQWHTSSLSGTPNYNRILFLLKHPELINTKLIMRTKNKYYKKTQQELEELQKDVTENTKNYY